MSAYVVQDKVINHIIDAVRATERETRYFSGKLGINTQAPRWEQELGLRMLSLNINAVGQRYNEQADTSPLETYRYSYKEANRVQRYKSLQCWLYQCSEGDVPSDPFYQLFEHAFKAFLADEIIRQLPEYDRADWS